MRKLLFVMLVFLIFSIFQVISAQSDDNTLSAGFAAICSIKADGSVICWGANSQGEGTPKPGVYTQISVGGYHTCGIKSSGAVACWGRNMEGQSTPLTGTFSQISAGEYHTCGVKTSGAVACWGRDNYDQSSPLPGTYAEVSAGYRHTCGRKTDNSVVCWGANVLNQLSVPPATTFKQISAGAYHTCGIKSDDTVVCWGDNASAQSSPVVGGTYLMVSAGERHTCGLKTDHTIACWGRNFEGQSTSPAGTFNSVSSGYDYNCGLKTNGVTHCWGVNTAGQQNVPHKAGFATTTGTILESSGAPFNVNLSFSLPSESAVTVNLAFSGTAIKDTDYTVSTTSVNIPAFGTGASFTITPIGDAVEPDETIIVDISSVTGGTEDGIQTATFTLTDRVEVVNDGSFEVNDIAPLAQPDLWQTAAISKDKLRCDVLASNSLCAYQFVGTSTENSQLYQTSTNVAGLSAGAQLATSVFYRTAGGTPKLIVKRQVYFVGVTTPNTVSKTITTAKAGWTKFNFPTYTIPAGKTVQKIKLTFQNKALAGSIFIDRASMTYIPVGPRSDGFFPLPPAP